MSVMLMVASGELLISNTSGGFYHGIQQYLNRMDKMNRKKVNKKQNTQEGK